ncbi:MAG: hypothetical protein Q9226_008480 [Calogaya cf. arnoldii]
MEREAYFRDMSNRGLPLFDDSSRENSSRMVEVKGIRLGEAADMYGDLGSAEEYGYVTRGLKSRHIQFIALGGTIGTGLLLGIGRAFIINLGGGSTHDCLGFRYWNNPGAMKAYKGTGSTGRFLGFFSVLVNAAFSYGGVEFLAVAAGEAKNPRHNIPKAVRRVFWRILFFYVLGLLAIGVLIP